MKSKKRATLEAQSCSWPALAGLMRNGLSDTIATSVKNSTKARQHWYLKTQMKSLEKASYLLKKVNTSVRHAMPQLHSIVSLTLLARNNRSSKNILIILFKCNLQLYKRRLCRHLPRMTLPPLQQQQLQAMAFSQCNHLLACLHTIAKQC